MIDINFIPHPLQGAPYGTALDLAIALAVRVPFTTRRPYTSRRGSTIHRPVSPTGTV